MVNINTYPSLYSTHPRYGGGEWRAGGGHIVPLPVANGFFFTLRSANGIDLPRAYTAATRPVF